jgi:hypothetical protein
MVGPPRQPRRATRASTTSVPTAALRPGVLCEDQATLEKLTQLGELQCTPEEAAPILGADVANFTRFLARNRHARAAFDRGRGQGLEALRRAQFKLAETNAAMAIFLGKTYLGQADRRELERSDAIDLSQAGQRVRDKLAALIAARTAQRDFGGD